MNLSTRIEEYNDTELLRYLEEDIENQGRQDELMQMMTCRDPNNDSKEIQCTSLQLALNNQKLKKAIFRMMKIGGRQLVMMNDEHGNTSLHYACQHENPSMETISVLLEMGGRELVLMWNNGRYGYTTALHCACENENISMEIISQLLQMGGGNY